ncbi:hypothetical protein [Puia dinghuensis]|uniref:Uncharacterized protein n=1 Tax=Puia dinghuensis TaxID=1792502 RepID=A0A8J2UJ58_9BACT|nr:hypothetical protein [Puia dinghuensis]GGB25412.1 hypothetical protein GCM10011511_56680 [Puia dinghuensis]
MQKASFRDAALIKKGQRYRINSFDLGFIDITPTDILVEVTDIHYDGNEVQLTPVALPRQDLLDPSGQAAGEIAEWFREIYPSRTKSNCLFRNAAAFEQFIDLRIAVLEESSS